jgi:NADH-quinone oxidoreductase subunit A
VLSVQNPDTEKLSSYECGFEPYEDARNIFDVKFYIVAILFILFDIEAMFLLPWCLSLSQLSTLGFWSMIDFVLELGVGFIYVWYVGALEWD